MFKDYLKKVIAAKEARAAELRKLIKQADTADEVRSLGETLQAVLDELSDAQEQLDAAEEDKGEEKEPAPAPDEREQAPAGAEFRGGNPLAAYGQHRAPAQRVGSILDTMEYRNAFAAYVRTGDESQFAALESRADATLITTDVGKIIPNTIMQEFIKDLKVYGNLYNRVRKLNVKGGVEFPIESLVPTVSWITETTVSDTQKAPELKTSVSFGYHICEARIAQSLLSQVAGVITKRPPPR